VVESPVSSGTLVLALGAEKLDGKDVYADPAGLRLDQAMAALQSGDPTPTQQAVEKIVDLPCITRSCDYFHSKDPSKRPDRGAHRALPIESILASAISRSYPNWWT
jgi:hypothetical protein